MQIPNTSSALSSRMKVNLELCKVLNTSEDWWPFSPILAYQRTCIAMQVEHCIFVKFSAGHLLKAVSDKRLAWIDSCSADSTMWDHNPYSNQNH